MYSFKNILNSNEKKIITDLLKINETINCLSEYEKLRIEFLIDEEKFNIEEWSRIIDYLSFLFYSTIHLHEIEQKFLVMLDTKVNKLAWDSFAEIGKEQMKTPEKPFSQFVNKIRPLMTYFVDFVDHMRRTQISINTVQSMVKNGHKEKFLEMWMGKGFFCFLNTLDLASKYVDRGYFVKSMVLTDLSELVSHKILDSGDFTVDILHERRKALIKAYNAGVKESFPYFAELILNSQTNASIELLEKSASDGDDMAYYLLSKIFRNGEFKKVNLERSFNYARCGAELGNQVCIMDLYNAYTDKSIKEQEKGKPDKKVIKELKEKFMYYSKLLHKHSNNNYIGKFLLGTQYIISEDSSRFTEGLELLYISALWGSYEALLLISKIYASRKIEIKSKRLKSLCKDVISEKDVNKNKYVCTTYPKGTFTEEDFRDDLKNLLKIILEKINRPPLIDKNNIIFFPKKYNHSKHLSPVYNFIHSGESEVIEFKSSLRWSYKENRKDKFLPFSVIKTVAAFLNTNGGNLLIGVNEDNETNKSEIIGLKNDYSTLQKKNNDGFEILLSDYFRDSLSSTVDVKKNIRITFESVDDVEVCIVNVLKSSKPVTVNFKTENREFRGAFFRRDGRSTIELTAEEVIKYVNDTRFNS